MLNSYWDWAKRRYDPFARFWLDQKPIPFVTDPNCPDASLKPGTIENPWWHSKFPMVINASVPNDRMYFFGFDGIHTVKL